MLIQTPLLDHKQLAQLDLLSADCKNADGNVVAIYRHLLGNDRHRPANILYYERDADDVEALVGFLGAFFFSEDTCEIALMVAPGIRRQGIASQMMKAILPLIQVEGIQRLSFSSPHGLNDPWLTAWGLHYENSEFQMQRSENQPIVIQNASVSVRAASDIDIPTLCAIDNACFSSYRVDMPERVHTLLNDPDHCLFIVSENGSVVGKGHLNWQSKGARLSDIAIIPDAQGRGAGTVLLAYCINHALAANTSNIVLDVETTNKKALNLYTRLGFSIINAHDYWSIDEIGLTGFLHHP